MMNAIAPNPAKTPDGDVSSAQAVSGVTYDNAPTYLIEIADADLEAILRRGQTRMIEERLAQAEITGSLEGYMPRTPESLFYVLMMQFADRPLIAATRVTLASFSAQEQHSIRHAAQAAFLEQQSFEAAVVLDPENEEPLRATRAGFQDMLAKASTLPDPTHVAPSELS